MKQSNSIKSTYILEGNRFTLPNCMLCNNFIENENKQVMRCKAFPDGIPSEVMWEPEENECNNGIKFSEDD